jgi:hypothetical protein
MVEVLERVVLHLVEQLTTDVEGCTLGEEHRLRPGDGDRSTHRHREREHPDPDVDRSFLVAGHHPLVDQIADQRRYATMHTAATSIASWETRKRTL